MADYAFRTLEDRQKIEKLWEDGQTPKEISETTGVSVHVVYKEMARGQDGTRLPVYMATDGTCEGETSLPYPSFLFLFQKNPAQSSSSELWAGSSHEKSNAFVKDA